MNRSRLIEELVERLRPADVIIAIRERESRFDRALIEAFTEPEADRTFGRTGR